jgi:hypothetical protein
VGYNPKVLTDQVALRKLHLELKDVTEKVDGKDVVKKVPHVRPAADDKAVSSRSPRTPSASSRTICRSSGAAVDESTNGRAPHQSTGPAYPEQRGGGAQHRRASIPTRRSKRCYEAIYRFSHSLGDTSMRRFFDLSLVAGD